MFDKSLYDLPCDLVGMSNSMLVADESQEELDRGVISLQGARSAIFTVQLQQVLLGMLFSRQVALPKNADQFVQELAVTRLG